MINLNDKSVSVSMPVYQGILIIYACGRYMIITIIADVYGKQNNGTAITAQRLIESLTDRGYDSFSLFLRERRILHRSEA